MTKLLWPRAEVSAFATWTTTGFLPASSPPIGGHGAVRAIRLLLSQRVRLIGDDLRALGTNLERLGEAWSGVHSTLGVPTWNDDRGRALLDIERVDLALRSLGDELEDLTLERWIAQLEALELFSRRWETDSVSVVAAVAVCGRAALAARLAEESLADLRGPEWYRPWVEWLSGAEVAPQRLADKRMIRRLEQLAIRSEWRALLDGAREELRRYAEIEPYDPDVAVDRPLVELLVALARLRTDAGSTHEAEEAFRGWFAMSDGEPMLRLTDRVPAVYLVWRELGRPRSPTETLAELRPEVRGLEPPLAPTFEIPRVARDRLEELLEMTRRAIAEGASIASNPVPTGLELLLGDEPGTEDPTSFADVI